LGWELVPPTIYRRENLPLGPGSLQVFIEHDPRYHYFNFEQDDRERLQPAALFDVLANNADRKGSHILLDDTGHIWLIDHGLCFHQEPKLRTVIWDFAGRPIPPEGMTALARLAPELERESEFAVRLHSYLTWMEIRATARRCASLVRSGIFPAAEPSRRAYPYPLL
jgi:uncharacterized repeat protein (TIGR03843 family)